MIKPKRYLLNSTMHKIIFLDFIGNDVCVYKAILYEIKSYQ